MGNVHTCGPDKALVISGGCCTSDAVRTVIGGYAWAWWCVTKVQKIRLGIMTLSPECHEVETLEGVPVTVTGIAQVKVMRDPQLLQCACEQFLDKTSEEIAHTILQSLEGHLRAILGTLTVETIYQDRDQFATHVRETAAPDCARMGIEILSFTIKELFDSVDYLNSLGRAQVANVKRDATIGQAISERDAVIKETKCTKERMDTRYAADTDIANNTKSFDLKKAEFDAEVNIIKAQSALAYELQAAKETQKIKEEEIKIEYVAKKKEIEIEEKEILRNEKELEATIKRPAEAEAFKMETIADGNMKKKILMAEASGEKITLIGKAQAASIQAVGLAEAEKMRLKADAYRQYGEAATLKLVLESLPKIAAEVAAPLGRTDEIVLLGGDNRTTNEVSKLLASMPPAIKALSGVDLTNALSQIPGARTK